MFEVFNYNLFTIRSLFGDLRLSENSKLSSITTSSVDVKPGSLFVPLRGNRDGHDFIPDALARNASAFLCEKNHPILKELNFEEIQKAIIVDNTLYALGKIGNFHRSKFQPIIIGITGSSGKTTTKELMGLIAEQIGKAQVVITEKNYNNEIGVPFTLLRINEKTKLVVCEMGMNHKSEISRLTAIARPTHSIITNVGPCHIENLGSIENIARAKAEIIEGMPVGSKVFIPRDILFKKIFQEKTKQFKVNIEFFSLKNNPDIQIDKMLPEGFSLTVFGEKLMWNSPGEKILENFSSVVAVARELNFSRDQIRKGLSSYKAKDKRFVVEKGYYKVINDTYNANPDSMKSSLSSLIQISSANQCYAILGDMKELGKFSKVYHSELGEFCQKISLSGLISFGKDADWIGKKFSSAKNKRLYKHFIDSEESMKELISFVKSQIPKGSFILVKGSRSMKMERIVEGLMH
jgi:UDP-N-acetylmuramoyl-tripeptide--D-alanyl-D-alanine ligase